MAAICSDDLGRVFDQIDALLSLDLEQGREVEKVRGTSPWRARQLLEVRRVCRHWRDAFDDRADVSLPRLSKFLNIPDPAVPIDSPWGLVCHLRDHSIITLLQMCDDDTVPDFDPHTHYTSYTPLLNLYYEQVDIVAPLASDGDSLIDETNVATQATDILVTLLWLEARDVFRRVFHNKWLPERGADRLSWQTVLIDPGPPRSIDNPRTRVDLLTYFKTSLADNTYEIRERFNIGELITAAEQIPHIRQAIGGHPDRSCSEYWDEIWNEVWIGLPTRARVIIRDERFDWVARGDPKKMWRKGPE